MLPDGTMAPERDAFESFETKPGAGVETLVIRGELVTEVEGDMEAAMEELGAWDPKTGCVPTTETPEVAISDDEDETLFGPELMLPSPRRASAALWDIFEMVSDEFLHHQFASTPSNGDDSWEDNPTSFSSG